MSFCLPNRLSSVSQEEARSSLHLWTSLTKGNLRTVATLFSPAELLLETKYIRFLLLLTKLPQARRDVIQQALQREAGRSL